MHVIQSVCLRKQVGVGEGIVFKFVRRKGTESEFRMFCCRYALFIVLYTYPRIYLILFSFCAVEGAWGWKLVRFSLGNESKRERERERKKCNTKREEKEVVYITAP